MISTLQAKGLHIVSLEDANTRVKEIGATSYLECSALTQVSQTASVLCCFCFVLLST